MSKFQFTYTNIKPNQNPNDGKVSDRTDIDMPNQHIAYRMHIKALDKQQQKFLDNPRLPVLRRFI